MTKIVPWQNPKTDPNPSTRASAAVLQGVRNVRKREAPIRAWLRNWWPALAWGVCISVLSTDTFSSEHTGRFFAPIIHWLAPSLSNAQVELVHHYIRKCAHFTEYFIFCALLYRSIRGVRQGWNWVWALAALGIAAGYSALDELHQVFVASRQARVTDSLLDSVGAFFAIVVLWLWARRRRAESAH